MLGREWLLTLDLITGITYLTIGLWESNLILGLILRDPKPEGELFEFGIITGCSVFIPKSGLNFDPHSPL